MRDNQMDEQGEAILLSLDTCICLHILYITILAPFLAPFLSTASLAQAHLLMIIVCCRY